jgi:hypothetical protein
LRPLRTANPLEIERKRRGEEPEREIFFLSGVRVVPVPRRKRPPEKTFGFGEVCRVDPDGPREAAKLDPMVKHISVHNIMAYQ